jgi:hypothetical protein
MPPKTAKTIKKAAVPKPARVAAGAGITAGLELWRVGTTFVLHDRSTDSRFASDVTTWGAAANLNATTLQSIKDAADSTRSR